MAVYEIELDLVARVLVPARDEAAAIERCKGLSGATIDLCDRRWIDTSQAAHPFRILGDMRIAAVRHPDGPLRRVSKIRLDRTIETAPAQEDGLIQPVSNAPERSCVFRITLVFTVAAFIDEVLRRSLEEMIDEPPKTHIDLEDASAYWLTMAGFDSDMFPMIISRKAVIGNISSQMVRPRRDRSGKLVDLNDFRLSANSHPKGIGQGGPKRTAL